MKFTLTLIDWQARAPGLSDADEWQAWSRRSDAIDPAAPLAKLTDLPMMTARRLNSGSRLAVDLGLMMLRKHRIDAVVYSSRHGELERNFRILQTLAAEQPVSPTDFAMSVHNSAVGNLTIAARQPVVSSSVSAGMDTFQQSLCDVLSLLHAGYSRVLLVDFDGLLPDFYHAGRWDLDLWGKNRAEVTARIGTVKAREAEQEQTRQLLASGVARLYWEWQTQAALKNVLMQIEHEQQNVVTVNRELYQHGITSSVEGVETDIDASKTQQQLNDVNGKMKVIEARLSALTNTQSAALKLRQVSLPAVESQLPSQLGYSLLARRADLQAAHWYIESSLSSIDAAKAAFYPDINLMAFLQQDALHLSDLFRHSAQQYGITGGLTLPIFDSGRLNANLDIAKAQSNLSIANYNKAVVDAVNDVARAASQVETLAQKNQHQQQIEHDAQRVVGLAQARFNAGIIAGSRVSEAKIPALREQCNGLLLQGQWLDASIQLTSALGGGYHS